MFATPISHLLGLGDYPSLVRAGAVGLWAQTNYQQLTALFRVEERSTAYAIASVANVLITVAAMVLFVAFFHWGAVGLVVGNFTGTLVVYLVLLAYRHEQLGLEFDRPLFRRMQTFGMPLVPSALALWAINFIDREFVSWMKGNAEVGVYSAAIKIASLVTFVLIAVFLFLPLVTVAVAVTITVTVLRGFGKHLDPAGVKGAAVPRTAPQIPPPSGRTPAADRSAPRR